jgi:hypothetical protein
MSGAVSMCGLTVTATTLKPLVGVMPRYGVG